MSPNDAALLAAFTRTCDEAELAGDSARSLVQLLMAAIGSSSQEPPPADAVLAALRMVIEKIDKVRMARVEFAEAMRVYERNQWQVSQQLEPAKVH